MVSSYRRFDAVPTYLRSESTTNESNAPLISLRENAGREELKEIVTRPLFYDSRRPFVATKTESTSDKKNSAAEQFRLIAIINSPLTKLALVESRSDKKVTRIRAGGAIGEWMVTEIMDDSAILSRSGKTETLRIDKPDR